MKCSRREGRAPREKQGPRIWGRDARESLGPRFRGDDENRRSSPRPEVGLACIRIGFRLDRIRPLGDACGHAGSLAARPPVPADLLHVVIELDRVAGRAEHAGAVVDAGGERRWDLDELAAALLEEVDRRAQLAVGRDLDAEAHHRRVRREAELFSERDRVERERMMFGAAAQEHAALAFPGERLGAREAHDAGVEGFHLRHVAAEKPHRTVAHDLERPRKQNSVDVVFRRHFFRMAEPRVEIDALLAAVPHLFVFGDLRQRRALAETPLVHRARLGQARPADLLHAVVDLVAVAFRVVRIAVPVGARHVAADARDAHLLRLEPVERVRHLGEARNLPGHLVHGDVGGNVAAAARRIVYSAVAQHERVVVGSVAQEIHVGVAEPLQLVFLRMVLGDVERIGDAEAQPLAVEVEAGRGIGDVQAEVPEPADFERLREQHAADVEFASGALCHDYSLWSGKSFSASAMLATQSRLWWLYWPMRPNFFARSSHTSGAGVMSPAPPASAPTWARAASSRKWW